MKRIVITLSFLIGLTTPVLADTAPLDAGPAVVIQPMEAGSGSGSAFATAPTPADTVANPVTSPVVAYDEAKAARKEGWAVLVFFCLVALTKALAYGRDKLAGLPGIGWIAAKLAVGKTAMIVAGIGALAAAGYNVLADGGTVGSALIAAGVALAGALHSTTKGA